MTEGVEDLYLWIIHRDLLLIQRVTTIRHLGDIKNHPLRRLTAQDLRLYHAIFGQTREQRQPSPGQSPREPHFLTREAGGTKEIADHPLMNHTTKRYV